MPTLDIVAVHGAANEADERQAADAAVRRLAAEARKAGWLAAHGGGATATLFLDEAGALPVPGGLGSALAVLSATGRPVAPWGVYPGGAALPEPYATVWELEALAARGGSAPAPLAPGPVPPARLVPSEVPAGAPLLACPGWLVHSFRGRKGHSRPELLPLVPRAARRVLEVGCGEGAFGAALESLGISVTGVEPDRGAAAVAGRRLTRVLDLTLDEAAEALEGESFDAVVLADVLEHLSDPVQALWKVRSLLRPGGELVFSLPNAQHASVLAGMIQGRWDRSLEGVVSFGHLTYAGRPGWARVLSAGGFSAGDWLGVPLEPPSLEPWVDLLSSAGLPPDEARTIQWTGRARLAEPGPAVDLPPEGGASEANPVFGAILETLLCGDLVEGRDARWALVKGTTRREREALFRQARPRCPGIPLPPLLDRVVSGARGRGLAVAFEDLLVEDWLPGPDGEGDA